MCGIAGIINPKDKVAIKKMAEAIRHRGPDEDGFFDDKYASLGMRRLSIIDLAGGTQPIVSHDGKLLIFFNGEVYNYKELTKELEKTGRNLKTKSDTEVVLSMFEVYGPECLPRLRGMFTFAIYNTETHKLVLARDFFGIKPLYVWKDDKRVKAFSSEIKSFLALPEFKPEVNDVAVYNYLSYQYNPLKETFFRNVYKLLPGHYMTIDCKTGHAEEKKYWQFEFKQNENLDEEKTAEKILEVMQDSVAHHMIADVPVGSFLSGGIDSSIIATLMQKIRGTNKIKTFTVGFDTLSEGKEAKETSEPLGTDHREITVGAKEYFEALPKAIWHFDEPVADPSALGLYFLAREARKHVTVVLSGEGADELFGGYNIYLEPFARSKISWIPRPILKLIAKLPIRGSNYAERASKSLEDRYIGNASIFNTGEVEKIWTKSHEKVFSLAGIYSEVKDLSEPTRMQYVDINTWLVGDILAKADKMTMAHSLELRVPFLDTEVAKLASKLPDKFKWKGSGFTGETKYLLRKAFSKVLPESTRTRKKLGFPTPVRDWFKKGEGDLYSQILGNKYILDHMDTDYIKKLIDDHALGKADNSRKIYLLLALSVWYNVFIEPK